MDTLAIIAMYDGPAEYQILSNLAYSPFELDGRIYQTVEGFWQGLKTDDPIIREKLATYVDGRDALQAGRRLPPSPHIFTYESRIYKVGSTEHHQLLERALRAKARQNKDVVMALKISGNRPFKHMLLNRFKSWRAGDSPALPAYAFEKMWTTIRTEVQQDNFIKLLPLPVSSWLNTSFREIE